MFRHAARGRSKRLPGQMNVMEKAYQATFLEPAFMAGEVLWYAYEPMKLKLAPNTFLTPDFGVMLASGEMQFRETKGFMEDDAAVKLKVAADIYWMYTFILVTKKAGVWTEKVIR
jgi:hypothetical protein